MPNGCRELSLSRVGQVLLAGLAELDKPVVTAMNCTDNRLAREAKGNGARIIRQTSVGLHVRWSLVTCVTGTPAWLV